MNKIRATQMPPINEKKLQEITAIHSRLQEAMQIRNISITNLSYALGVSKASVSEWLRGGGLSINNLAAIALEMNISVNWLLMGKGSMNLFGPIHPTAEEMELIYHTRRASETVSDAFFNMISNIAKPVLGDDPLNQLLAIEMLEQSGMALVIVDNKGIVTDVNDACLGLFGDNLDKTADVIGTHFSAWLEEDDIAKAMTLKKTSFERGHNTNFTCRLKRKLPAHHFDVNFQPYIDVTLNSLYCGTKENGDYHCIVFPLE